MPRSDITPQVLEAVRAMNATEDDKGNLHDEGNGQFVSKGDTGFNQPDGDGSSGDISPEQQQKIDSVKIDFSKDNTLPKLNQDTIDELGPDADKPYYNFIKRIGEQKHSLVLLEVTCNKDNCEIVYAHWLTDKSRKTIEKKKQS